MYHYSPAFGGIGCDDAICGEGGGAEGQVENRGERGREGGRDMRGGRNEMMSMCELLWWGFEAGGVKCDGCGSEKMRKKNVCTVGLGGGWVSGWRNEKGGGRF